MKKEPEFYIGWQAAAPPGIARTMRKTVAALFFGGLAVAFLVVLNQRGFSSSTFELGKKTTLEGWITAAPYPMLVLPKPAEKWGQQLILVSPFKFGGMKKIKELEKKTGIPLIGRRVRAVGTLIYVDGKATFELDDATVLPTENGEAAPVLFSEKIADTVCLRGEIADPKCLFGAMRPGEGKPHLDCAVRCISGGIPPVLKTIKADGRAEYYLLTGPAGQPLNREVLPFVGYGVCVPGRVEKVGDWLFLRAETPGIRAFFKGSPSSFCQ